MGNSFSVDSSSPFASSQIKEHLYSKLENLVKQKRTIIFLCIGTDRVTGDTLGPLIGYKLRNFHKENIFIYGTLEKPVHSCNLVEVLNKIHQNFSSPYIVAIDACLGNVNNIGKVFIDDKPLNPGLAVNKDLPPVGDMSITGVVNICGYLEFMVLQNTRLYTVMALADCISSGISGVIFKLSSDTKNSFNTF